MATDLASVSKGLSWRDFPESFTFGASSDSYQNSFVSPRRASSPIPIRSWSVCSSRPNGGVVVKSASSGIISPISETATEKSIEVKGIITIKVTGLFGVMDDITELATKNMLIELVSAELDPKTGAEKPHVKVVASWAGQYDQEIKYECDFQIPKSFGEIGAVLVENEHNKELFFKDITFTGLQDGPLTFVCESWVHSKFDNPTKRTFFTTKSFLPSETPNGLKRLRELELTRLRGNGEGERKKFDRIYDYEFYNDLGNPDDKSGILGRPVLGGHLRPYPRRCRTGRPPTKTDPDSESPPPGDFVYIPRDEEFSSIKSFTFGINKLKAAVRTFLPMLRNSDIDTNMGFPSFTAIDTLYREGILLPNIDPNNGLLANLPRIIKFVVSIGKELVRFELPELLRRDKFSWLKDEEFSRQTLAGLNPYSLQLVKEWPLTSNLDPDVYGSPESLITKELVERQIGGDMKVEEALEKKKLFIIDYHDTFLPYVHKVRKIEGTTLYGSRTLFFLTKNETLKPIAIELTRPKDGDKQDQWKEVYTPGYDNANDSWLWKFAKAHVLAHDAGYHQLISHWLRTHCCMEPYIIAANRQLSVVHPIYRLLNPHFRYTMEINAFARYSLTNAGGIIESTFSPGKYCMEISSVIYDQQWRFDMEAFPADLVKRGLAVESPDAEYGLELTIKDHPFANDGLLLWDAIKNWVTEYVNHYYPKPELIESDQELQAFWTEVRTKGHEDKKDEPWWPELKTPNDLIKILTTMIWVPSGHHAAVNFGQYMYAGYIPNRPTIARTNMPTENPSKETNEKFMKNPESILLECFPSQIQATQVMATLDVLSDHSPDEEYIGHKLEPAWEADPVIKAAFERFSDKLKELEETIDDRNADIKLKNRAGAGVVPYELLKPFSKPGVTGMGVPNSISI